MRFNTPLRYPGGKGKLTNFMIKVIELNKLQQLHYAEPFAGGAGLAFNLLAKGYAEKIYLNDINRSVYAFWFSVLNHTSELCSKIEDTSVTIDEWHNQKNLISQPESLSIVDLAFSAFFLNRTNRSGILQGGVIGGKNQDGIWKLDARYNKTNLIKRIEAISILNSRIEIHNLDAIDFIDDIVLKLPQNSLTYLDPPYYVKGKGLYENHYNHDDHLRIAKKIQKDISSPWIVSYDSTPQIQEMYNKCNNISYGINYSAQDRYKGSEIMFFSKNLSVPNIADPTKG